MEKLKKYSPIIVLAIVLLVAIIIGIIKFMNINREIEVIQMQKIDVSQKDEVITVNKTEVEQGEVKEKIQEGANAQIPNEEVPKEEPKQENIPQQIDKKQPYYIKVNYKQNTITIYAKDDQGDYTKPIKAMACSCGTETPTKGVYKTKDKYEWKLLFGGVYGQYSTRIVNHILFHSVPYLKSGDKSSLKYKEYDKLGTKASAGCIRLTVEDAKWIYDNCAYGTQVEFYADSNPGPLGKPTTQKISSNEVCRGWDPTDPDVNNPWRTYGKPTEEPKDPIVEQEQEVQKPEETIPEVNPEENPDISNNDKTEVPEEPSTPTEPDDSETGEDTTKPNVPEVPEGDGEGTKPDVPEDEDGKMKIVI